MKRISDYLLGTAWCVPLVQGALCAVGAICRPATVVLVLAAGLAGCDPFPPKPPRWDQVCVKSHTQQRWVPKVAAPFQYPQVGGLALVTDTICDKYERQCIKDPEWKGQPQECK